jgi:hypothetical protein
MQVIVSDLKISAIWTGVGAPWTICITPGTKQYHYSSDAKQFRWIHGYGLPNRQ